MTNIYHSHWTRRRLLRRRERVRNAVVMGFLAGFTGAVLASAVMVWNGI